MVLLGNRCMPERGNYAAPKYDNETGRGGGGVGRVAPSASPPRRGPARRGTKQKLALFSLVMSYRGIPHI